MFWQVCMSTISIIKICTRSPQSSFVDPYRLNPRHSPIRLVSPQISFIYTRISSKCIHMMILSFHARCCIHLEFHSFLLLSSIPLYGYTTIHQVMDTWINYGFFLFIYIHKCVFADTCFKWFRVTPACFPEANVLFYTVINSKDSKLTYKYLLAYGESDIEWACGIGDTEKNLSLPTLAYAKVSFWQSSISASLLPLASVCLVHNAHTSPGSPR